MNKYIQSCIGLLSIAGRILVFFCFWWAYDGVAESFGDKRLGYQNEFYAWESPPIFKISQYFAQTYCPSGASLLYNFIWNGRKSFDEGEDSFNSIPAKQFTKWAYEKVPDKSFILCAVTGLKTESYAYFGQSNKTCEDRKMRSCSNGRFCVPATYQYCPITSVHFDSNGTLVTQINNEEMPIAYFKVDTYFVSGYNNKDYNIYSGQPQDEYLQTKLKPVDIEYKDDNFVSVNTINDVLFYKINDASGFDRTVSATYNHTLFYRRYTEWDKTALGPLFIYAFNIFDSLDEIIILSDTGTITALIYLLLICYIMPALPVVCKCITALKPENIIAWDMLARMIVLFMMLAQSTYIIAQCEDVRNYSAQLMTDDAVNYSVQYDDVIALIDDQEPYHFISIIISVGLLFIEFLLWFIIGVKLCIRKIIKCFKIIQFRKQIKKDLRDDEQLASYQQVNQRPQEINEQYTEVQGNKQ